MLREIFSMISPFRGLSRARRSAAFGGADEVDMDEVTPDAAEKDAKLGQPSKLDDVQEAVGIEDRTIEEAEEGLSTGAFESSAQKAPSSQLSVLSEARSASRSPSPRPRSRLAAPPKSLPLADSGLVTPGLRRQFDKAQSVAVSSTPIPSTSFAPNLTQTSPVSRNYDLLARFFSEKQRGGQGGLTEVEVEGCIRLIEESMASGRNLESEFTSAPNYVRHLAPKQTSGFAPSSRASSVAPPALPSSQSTTTLFHPGTSKFNTSSSAYSFLAPRAPASQPGFGGATSSSARRRPIYLGPGMSGLSLHRRRPVVASASRAAAMSKPTAFGSMPRSSTDPDLARFDRDAADQLQDASDRTEEAKRRRTGMHAAGSASSSNGRAPTADQTVQFEPAYEGQARQSSLLAKNIAVPMSANVTLGSSLKRAAPSPETIAAASIKSSPPKTTTRTASAIQDILKATPPVRPPTQPELINPYQSAAPLSAKSKTTAGYDSAQTTPPRRSARTSMLTRAKARETARAAEKHSPPKESVLDLIERTAPKTASQRKAVIDASEHERNGLASSTDSATKPIAEQATTEERRLQKTEEVQRRLEALNKAKSQQKEEQSSISKPATANNASTVKVATSLVPPQYTASKPKKPSPLSAAFQAPDSPSSDSETVSASPAQARAPSVAQPSFSFGSPAKATVPSSGFSFSTAKPDRASAASAATTLTAAATPSGGFSFSKPEASVKPATTSAAPASIPSFSFSPVATASAQQKPAASSAPANAGFSFSHHSDALVSSSSKSVSTQPNSIRSQVLDEDAACLPRFDWQVPTVSAPIRGQASQVLRDEIKLVAQAALPKFDFIYEIETCSDTPKSAATEAASPLSTGFNFCAPIAASASPAATTNSDNDTETDTTDDPSKITSSGLLGEGEGEESESTLLTVRSKIWKFDMSTKSWKDLGVCIAKVKYDSSTNKHRLLARNEANGKVAVNFLVYKGLKSSLEKTVNAFLGFEGQEPTQYRIKVKTEQDAKELKSVLEEAAA